MHKLHPRHYKAYNAQNGENNAKHSFFHSVVFKLTFTKRVPCTPVIVKVFGFS